MKREFMKLRNVRWTVFGIGCIYVCPGFCRRLSLLQHPHDILRNVYANGTAEGMIVKGDIALRIHI